MLDIFHYFFSNSSCHNMLSFISTQMSSFTSVTTQIFFSILNSLAGFRTCCMATKERTHWPAYKCIQTNRYVACHKYSKTACNDSSLICAVRLQNAAVRFMVTCLAYPIFSYKNIFPHFFHKPTTFTQTIAEVKRLLFLAL